MPIDNVGTMLYSDYEMSKQEEIKKCWNCGGNCQGIEACMTEEEYARQEGGEE